MRTRFVKHLSLLSFLIVVVFFVLWFIMPGTNEIKISLGSDYYIIDDGMSYCLVLQPQEKGGKPIVEGGIRSWNEDKRNIVVFRVLTSEIKQWYDIKTSDHYEFWIIDKKNGSVYGPAHSSVKCNTVTNVGKKLHREFYSLVFCAVYC